jgi:hypothetical protein
MANAITLKFKNSAQFRRDFRSVTARQVPQALAAGLNKTALDVLDAEKAAARAAFPKASAKGEKFLGGEGSFRFFGATPKKLRVEIFPNPKRSRITGRRTDILLEHQAGAMIRPTETRLAAKGYLAVPQNEALATRSRAGVVAGKFQPQRLLVGSRSGTQGPRRRGEGRAGYIRGQGRKKVILQRRGRGKEPTVLFVLIPTADLKRRDFFHRTAEVTARAVFQRKLTREFQRIRDRGK